MFSCALGKHEDAQQNDGGEDGGRIVATGTPEQVMKSKKSFTAEALRKLQKREPAA